MITGKATHLIKNHKHWAAIAIALMVFGACKAAELLAPVKEIALIIDEPWKDMQARSSAEIADDIPDEIWYRIPKQLARMRFADPQHEFVTPPAKFFTVGFNRGKIDSVRMSPQVEPLPLNDALNIVLDLQEQWRKSGWELMYPEEHPAHEFNAEWTSKLSKCHPDSTYWQVKGKYQIMVIISCFDDPKHPNEQRFLINLSMGKPWH